MVTKKKPIKVRRRILSNKRTKGGNKKQHSKKRRNKRTKNKIKGGARGEARARAKRKSSSLENSRDNEYRPSQDPAKKAKNVISFVLVDLHGSYEDKKKETPNNIGVGLRDDIMTWFFSRYTNSTPNIQSDELIKIILNHYEHWGKIFTGLKQMETDYKMFYKLNKKESDICPNKENIELALNFIDELSVPFQEAIKQGIEAGGPVGEIYLEKCSGPQAGSHGNNDRLSREGSERLQNTACGCEKEVVQSTSWINFINDLVKQCTDFMYPPPPKYVDSKWHIAATLSAIESIPDSDASIRKRKNQLYCLTYGKKDRNMGITIFTKKINLDYAFENYHLEELGTDENGLINTRFFSYITPEEESQGIDVTCIKIFYDQFKNIQQYFLTSLSYRIGKRNEFVKGDFGKNQIFFIDDINFILYKLFNLSQDEIINFYESCRGRPDAS